VAAFAILALEQHDLKQELHLVEAERTFYAGKIAQLESQHIWYNLGLESDRIANQIMQNNTNANQDNLELIVTLSKRLAEIQQQMTVVLEILAELPPPPSENIPERNPKIST
jgi:hypothetical protein